MDDEFYDFPTEVQTLNRSGQVIVNLKPVASAPILKKTKFKVSGEETFSILVQFVRTQTKVQGSLFLYVNSSFCPPGDAVIGDLFKCFKVSDELIINYAVSEAWG